MSTSIPKHRARNIEASLPSSPIPPSSFPIPTDLVKKKTSSLSVAHILRPGAGGFLPDIGQVSLSLVAVGWLPGCGSSQRFRSPWPTCYLPRGPSTCLVTVEELGTFLSSLCGFRMRRTVWAQSPPSGFWPRRRRGSDEDSVPSRTKRRLPILSLC